MTDIQYERWKEFSIKMAGLYPDASTERVAEILKKVSDYFECRDYDKDWPEIKDWDGNDDDYHLSTEVYEFFDNLRPYDDDDEDEDDDDSDKEDDEDKEISSLYNQVTCCIRAGFDVAVCPSGGVVGFTAGDVRRWWGLNVPDWVKEYFDEPFDTFGDDDDVWL